MRSMRDDMQRARSLACRPSCFHDILRSHTDKSANGGVAWLTLVTSGKATDPAAQAAVSDAVKLLLEHAEQRAQDLGYTPTEYNIADLPASQGTRGEIWGDRHSMQTLYRGIRVPKKDDGRRRSNPVRGEAGASREQRTVGLDASDEIQPGELRKRVVDAERRRVAGDASGGQLLPATRPDRLVRWDDSPVTARGERATATRLRASHACPSRRPRCDELHEADRILRAHSLLGVLCTPVDGPALGQAAIGTLYEEAKHRCCRTPPGFDVARVPRALERLRHARDEMIDPAKQAEVRRRWREEGWTRWVTTTLRCAVDVAALETYAATPQANRVPLNKHGQRYRASEKDMIRVLLTRVERSTPDARIGSVVVRYWFGKCGTALLDAGLVITGRETAVPPDWHYDPFSLPKKLRGIAFGAFNDFDDNGSHPRARLNIVAPGAQMTKRFIEARDEVLYGMGAQLFPQAPQREQRDRVKGLFSSIDMDGNVRTWAAKWGMDVETVKAVHVPLANGALFSFRAYLSAQSDGTFWLQEKLDRQVGFSSFIEAWLRVHKPHKTHPERTVKSFCFSEAESISREAKAEWCRRNGHAVLSLQHDGLVVALAAGTDPLVACGQMRVASESALGYEQPAVIKPPELPEGVQRAALLTREEAERDTPSLGRQQTVELPPVPPRTPYGLWQDSFSFNDTEQYGAAAVPAITADAVLRLFLRSERTERGAGITARTGQEVVMDQAERTVMAERGADGASQGVNASRTCLWCALDLHARHHFTRAAAVDGSLKEDEMPGRRLRRRVAYGVFEGLQGSGARQSGVWGARLPSDLEVMDAEMFAIHEYLRDVVESAGVGADTERVLVQSDCLGALDAIEAAWRAGGPRGLRGRDRGAMLESICRLRARLDRVIFMFTPSHKGISSNAMADAAAKAHLAAREVQKDAGRVHVNIHSRPCIYSVCSDFEINGMLYACGDKSPGEPVVLDRRLFPAARKRVARWVHRHLAGGLSDAGKLVDPVFVGRRAHACESRAYVEVAKAGIQCAKLDRKEEDPVGRMAADCTRVSIVAAARNGQILGVHGAQDLWWRRALIAERKANTPGPAMRSGIDGCAACQRVRPGDDAVCDACNGWRTRGRRGKIELDRPGCINRRACAMCGGGCAVLQTATARGGSSTVRRAAHACADDNFPGRGADEHGWLRGTRDKRRLGPVEQPDGCTPWVGFAGLARTTVERLLGEGAALSEDARAATAPVSSVLANVRHVLGGECESLDVNAIRAEVQSIERQIVSMGGATSDLRAVVARAHAYLATDVAPRSAHPAEGWDALRRLIACDVPAPDWALPGGLTEDEVAAARKDRDKRMVGEFMHLVGLASDLRAAWQEAAAPRVAWRDRMEASRGILRVIMRAWREVADGARAGTAKWEGRWQDSEAHAPLARRLQFSDAGSAMMAEAGWRLRVMLAWQRLVRAEVVHRRRRCSPLWRAAERRRLRRMVSVQWGCEVRGSAQSFQWHNEEDVAMARHVTSGAAAVIARRLEPAGGHTDDRPDSHRHRQVAKRQRQDADRVVPPVEAREIEGLSSGAAGRFMTGADNHGAAATTRRRAVDGLLVFNERTRERLERTLGQWWWRSAPFGDG